MRWFWADKLSLIYRNIPFILLLSDFSKLQGHFSSPRIVKMKLKQTRVSSGNEIQRIPCCWCRTDLTAAAAGLEGEHWAHSEPDVPHTLHSSVTTELSYPTQAPQSCRIPDFLLVELDSASGDSDSDPSVQVWPQLWEIYKELCSLCLALILSPRWSPVGWNTLRLTSLEFLLLLSSRNCCRVTTSLPGEPVLVCLPQLSGVLCWSTGLDLVWPFRYWMGLLLLLDQASCSWSRLNSPLLWLWGLLWLFTAPASGGRQSVFPLEIHQRAVNLQNPTPIRNATRFS